MSQLVTTDLGASRSRTGTVVFLLVALGLPVAQWLLWLAHGQGLAGVDPSTGAWGGARGYGPTVAALVACLWVGRPALRNLGRRLAMWRVPPVLAVLAVAGPLAANLVAVGLVAVTTDIDLSLGSVPVGRLLLIPIVFALIDGPLGEEIGWRGFLLPALLERWSSLGASLVIGVVWFLWHLPLYAIDGRELNAEFLLTYLASVVALAVVYTWFFERSGGSALLAVVLHTFGNTAYYLAITLVPGLRAEAAYRYAYVTVVVAVGLVAAVALLRSSRAELVRDR